MTTPSQIAVMSDASKNGVSQGVVPAPKKQSSAASARLTDRLRAGIFGLAASLGAIHDSKT
jgi:hypothetical protein